MVPVLAWGVLRGLSSSLPLVTLMGELHGRHFILSPVQWLTSIPPLSRLTMIRQLSSLALTLTVALFAIDTMPSFVISWSFAIASVHPSEIWAASNHTSMRSICQTTLLSIALVFASVLSSARLLRRTPEKQFRIFVIREEHSQSNTYCCEFLASIFPSIFIHLPSAYF